MYIISFRLLTPFCTLVYVFGFFIFSRGDNKFALAWPGGGASINENEEFA